MEIKITDDNEIVHVDVPDPQEFVFDEPIRPIPVGGEAGMVLTKVSDEDNDVDWHYPPTSQGQVSDLPSTVTYVLQQALAPNGDVAEAISTAIQEQAVSKDVLQVAAPVVYSLKGYTGAVSALDGVEGNYFYFEEGYEQPDGYAGVGQVAHFIGGYLSSAYLQTHRPIPFLNWFTKAWLGDYTMTELGWVKHGTAMSLLTTQHYGTKDGEEAGNVPTFTESFLGREADTIYLPLAPAYTSFRVFLDTSIASRTIVIEARGDVSVEFMGGVSGGGIVDPNLRLKSVGAGSASRLTVTDINRVSLSMLAGETWVVGVVIMPARENFYLEGSDPIGILTFDKAL